MKSGIGWLLLSLPKDAVEDTGAWAKSLNVHWLAIGALIGAAGLGVAATSWYYQQVQPEDVDIVEQKVDVLLERQDAVVEDLRSLRRSVCRLEGGDATECERRVRQDRDRYEYDFESGRGIHRPPPEVINTPLTRRRR
jgi:hypothetical protein